MYRLRYIGTICTEYRPISRRSTTSAIGGVGSDRGSSAAGTSPAPDGRRPASPYARRVWSQRAVIDYALAAPRDARRRCSRAGRSRCDDACDAHPYLLRAARHHGEPHRPAVPGLPRGAADRGDLRLRRRARPVLRAASRRRAELSRDGPRARRVHASTSSRSARAAPGTTWSAPTSSVTESTARAARGSRPDRRTPVRRTARTAVTSHRRYAGDPRPAARHRRTLHEPVTIATESRLPAPGARRLPSLRALVAAAAGAGRDRLPRAGGALFGVAYAATEHPAAERDGQRADHDRLLPRRQDRDRAVRRARTGSSSRSTRCPTTCRRPCSRPRTGRFYENRGISPTRHRPGVLEQPARRRRPRAARRSPSSTRRTPTCPRSAPTRASSRSSSSRSSWPAATTRTRSCRTTSTPSTSAAAPTASRPPRRPTSARTSASSPSPQGAVLASVIRSPGRLRPRRATPTGWQAGSTTCSTAWSAKGGSPRRDRAGLQVPPTVADGRKPKGGTNYFLMDTVRQELKAQRLHRRRRSTSAACR